MLNLDSSLELLGFSFRELPALGSKPINLYTNFGSTPIAKLFLTDRGYTLRFGFSIVDEVVSSSVEVLPSGAISIKSVRH